MNAEPGLFPPHIGRPVAPAAEPMSNDLLAHHCGVWDPDDIDAKVQAARAGRCIMIRRTHGRFLWGQAGQDSVGVVSLQFVPDGNFSGNHRRRRFGMARKAPESAGSRMRREILEQYELNPVELLLLDRAVSIADTLERIDREVAKASLVTVGSTGQRVAEPLLREQREHAARLASILEALRLPCPDELTGRSSTSLSAQRAASIRWAREKANNGAVA